IVERARRILAADGATEQRDASKNSAFMWAATMGNASIVRMLLDAGADSGATDMMGRTALDRAKETKQADVIAILAQLSSRRPAVKTTTEELLDAIKRGDVLLVEKILSDGADVNAADQFGWRPLSRAIDVNSAQVVRRLLDAGAGINATDRDGSTALDLALRRGRSEIVQVLL